MAGLHVMLPVAAQDVVELDVESLCKCCRLCWGLESLSGDARGKN